MKKLLNTLFATTQGAYLAKEGETVVVKIDGEVAMRLPIHTLGGIVCFGQVSCSPYLLGFCAESNITIRFLTENGSFLAKVQGPVSGNVLLRREQYRRANDLKVSASVSICLSLLAMMLLLTREKASVVCAGAWIDKRKHEF